MAICVYDNPESMMRERYEDKKLVCAYSSDILDELPEGFFKPEFDVDFWVPDQIVGNTVALPDRIFLI
jgi:hypothetical protein